MNIGFFLQTKFSQTLFNKTLGRKWKLITFFHAEFSALKISSSKNINRMENGCYKVYKIMIARK